MSVPTHELIDERALSRCGAQHAAHALHVLAGPVQPPCDHRDVGVGDIEPFIEHLRRDDGANLPSSESCEHVLALGAPDVPAAAAALRERGVTFVETAKLHVDTRGALTQSWLGGLMFELVHCAG